MEIQPNYQLFSILPQTLLCGFQIKKMPVGLNTLLIVYPKRLIHNSQQPQYNATRYNAISNTVGPR